MDFLNNSLLRRTLAPQPEPDPHAEPRKRLLDALLKMRERAAMLANEIHRDLPDFTVHDITHLDALWEMADLIAGPDYPLNPLEAFALGVVFLLHDLGLGLAAYPGGLAELKKGPGWEDALSTYLRKHLERIPTAEELASPPPEVERMAVQERLRVLHAERAERLALASWRHGGGPEYHLIDDPDLRQAIGPLLGKIAHSHWWPVSRLGNEFGTVRGALTHCPREWTLDPLKVAALLRTADAAHLDERRAPGFLIALRRPEGLSEEHWRFQNHLLKPRLNDDRLVYTTSRPFPPEEVNDWWLCEETLRMVDRELRQVDALFADWGHSQRLKVRGVAGTESPNRLQIYVEVSGWTPVDARLHVSNVADLARKMGGEQLYGDNPTVPLRELIQNASDAVRARRLLEDRSSDWGRITVRLGRDDQGPWAEVEDTGIGMSEAVLMGPLLDFGTSYWGSGLMREEHEGLWAKGFEPTGRFGIGFFSLFMWGKRLQVITRRYDDNLRDTRILEFRAGLEARPFVRFAGPGEQLRDGGTRVRVWLSKEPTSEGGLLNCMVEGGRLVPTSLGRLCAWLAPALDVDLYVEERAGCRCVVAASDWLRIDGANLVSRVVSFYQPNEEFLPTLEVVKDSRGGEHILGRAALVSNFEAIVTVGGLRSGYVADKNMAGILIGYAGTVVRNSAAVLADQMSISLWASRQARMIIDAVPDKLMSLEFGAMVLMLGGDIGSLPIARRNGRFLNRDNLSRWAHIPDHVTIIGTSDLLEKEGVRLYNNVIEMFDERSAISAIPLIRVLISECLARSWGCAVEEVVWSEHAYEIGSSMDERPIRLRSALVLRKPK